MVLRLVEKKGLCLVVLKDEMRVDQMEWRKAVKTVCYLAAMMETN